MTEMSDPTATFGDDDVLTLQLRALDKSAPSWVLAIVGAPMMTYPYWETQSAFWIAVWMTSVTLVSLIALGTIYCRKHHLGPSWTSRQWAMLARAYYLVAGCNWGAGCWWFLAVGEQGQALVVSCIGLSAVMIVMPAVVYRAAFNLFHLPVFLGLAAGFALSSLDYNILLTAGSLLLAACLTLISNALGQQLVMALRLLVDNKRLTKRLAKRGSELESLNKELLVESATDPLTGVANRRSLMSFTRDLTGRYAIIIADIDHFKSYNDRFGHADGDVCLVAIANALRLSVRPEMDLVARLGGEEFVVVVTDVAEPAAMAAAETIRSNVAALFESRASQLRRRVTVSIGVATVDPSNPRDLAVVMQEADSALYRAKASGRDKVVSERTNALRLVVA